jgi:trimethylamine---corrinoid protein Co-methyltransferase
MKSRLEVLSDVEIEQLHAASMNVLAETGVKVEYNLARNLFREAGCLVKDEEKSVRIPEKLIKWAVNQAPDVFTLYGHNPEFRLEIGGGNLVFAGLGTPTSILDNNTGLHRPTTFEDLLRHIKML